MLVAEDLRVELGGMQILREVALTVSEGGIVGLVGRNGAGKTTTLRAVLGLVKAGSTTLNLAGTALGSLPAHARVRLGIGYAPEDRGLVSGFSVEENLMLPAHACGLDENARARGLARVYALLPELASLKTRPAGALSGGQQKMAALGRALMVGHRLLLLDEPFQGLAPALARRYAEALAALREGAAPPAILVTESNPALLESLVQCSYTIERGEVTRSY